MMRTSVSKFLMTSVLGALVFSASFAEAQNLSINPYPKGGEGVVSRTTSGIASGAVKQISNGDTGVSIGDIPARKAVVKALPVRRSVVVPTALPEPVAPSVSEHLDDIVVRWPTRPLSSAESAKSALDGGLGKISTSVPKAVVSTHVATEVPMAMVPIRSVQGQGARNIVRRKGGQTTRELLDAVLDDGRGMSAASTAGSIPQAPVAVIDNPPVVAAPPVVQAAPPRTRVYTNAHEFNIMLGESFALPVEAAPIPVLPSSPSAVSVQQVQKSKPIVNSMALIQPQKQAKFVEKPMVGLLEAGDPVRASHLLRVREARARGIVPIKEVNMPMSVAPTELRYVEPLHVEPVRSGIAKAVPVRVKSEIPTVSAVEEVVKRKVRRRRRRGDLEARHAWISEEGQQNTNVASVARRGESASTAVFNTYKADVEREYSTPREWKALQGYALKDILYSWSARAGVRLVWDTPGHYMIPAPLRVKNTYQNAVQTLLDQFDDGANRPVGEIYKDSQTAERYLVIRTGGDD